MKLIPNWKTLWRAWSLQFGVLGLVLPEILQILADNTDLLAGFDDGYKSGIRLACLFGVVLLRPVKQKEIS